MRRSLVDIGDHWPRKEAMGSSGRQRFIRKASISSSVGALTSSRLLYGLFLSSSCIRASICFTRLSSASSAWETEMDQSSISQISASKDIKTYIKMNLPSLVSLSSSLRSLNHCCQSDASCSFCSSFSSSSLLPSCLDASEDWAQYHDHKWALRDYMFLIIRMSPTIFWVFK